MIWHLLWLYPLIGLCAIVPCWLGDKKRDLSEGVFDFMFMAFMLTFLWPITVGQVTRSWAKDDVDAEEIKELEYQALLERVRKERHAPDPRLAEFDIQLGIEPEPKQFFWEDTINDSWEMPEYRVRDIARKTRFSKGGHIKMMSPNEPILNFYDPNPPTTAELRSGIDFSIGLDKA